MEFVLSLRTPEAALPEIAVIVPNRNYSRYLPRCIRSVLEQEDPPDELIVVDDQSTDNSVELIRSLINGQSRARLIENPVNLGGNRAVDEGLKIARSEYVLFLSANDFVMPGLFARARSCLRRYPGAGFWSALGWLVDEEDKIVRLHTSPVVSLRDVYIPPEQCVRLAYRLGNWTVGATLVYHRDTLEAVGRFDPAYMGLADLITTWIVAGRRGAAYSPVPLGAGRIHPGGFLSKTLTIANVDAILDRLQERGPRLAPEVFTKAFLERMALRFRFATARAGRGQDISRIAATYSGFRRFALRAIEQWVPPRLQRARIALAFLVLCPFDVLPALWNRLLGSAVVLLLLRLRGQGSYPALPGSTGPAGKRNR